MQAQGTTGKEPPKEEMITKETAAREIYHWLTQGTTLFYIAVAAPFVCVVASNFNQMAGGVLALASTIAAALFGKNLVAEKKRVGIKYGFIIPKEPGQGRGPFQGKGPFQGMAPFRGQGPQGPGQQQQGPIGREKV